MKAGEFAADGVPGRVLEKFADGARHSVNTMTSALADDDIDSSARSRLYGNVAQALYAHYLAGHLARTKVRGKFVYWRAETPASAVAS